MKNVTIFSCALLLVMWLNTSAANDILQKHIPSDVQMGMTKVALIEARPRVKDAGLDSSDGRYQLVEMVSSKSGREAYWYRFKNEVLGSVTKSVSVKNVPAEQAQKLVSATQTRIQEAFDLIGTDQIVRTSGGQTGILSAQRWREKSGDLDLYFVASNLEITLIFFDAKNFDQSDFFLGPARLADVRENKKRVLELTREIAPESSEPESVPLIDFLSPQTNEPLSQGSPSQAGPEQELISKPDLVENPLQNPAEQESETQAEPPSLPKWPYAIILLALVGIVVLVVRSRKGKTPR